MTFGFSFAHRGLPVPYAVPRLELRLPSGAAWSRGADTRTDAAISGDAVEFALVVTQRRNHRDTSLVAHGDVARRWFEIAQCFAGPRDLAVLPRSRMTARTAGVATGPGSTEHWAVRQWRVGGSPE